LTGGLAWLLQLAADPIRAGEHSNTAFAIGLRLDYARIAGSTGFGQLVETPGERVCYAWFFSWLSSMNRAAMNRR
jgi:hypothetical protein